MPVKIRLARRGRRKKPFYHIIVADSRSPRDGRFIEKLGIYNPMTNPATIDLDRDKAFEWLMKGAQPTDTAKAILKIKGVLYRKHLARGVAKGAMTEEQAETLYQDWIKAKEEKIQTRIEQTKKEKEDFLKAISGKAKPVKQKEEEASPLLATEEASVEEAPKEEVSAEATEKAEAEPAKEAPVEEVVEAAEAEEAPKAEEDSKEKEE